MSKQIYAGLEVADHEIRLIVGEFFNTRLNILKVERVDCEAVDANQIHNKDALIEAIRKGLQNVEKNIGLPVTKVILSIPSVKVQRYHVKEKVQLNSVNKVATYRDIRKAMSAGMKHVDVPKDRAIVQVNCVKFYCNGIATRRCPIDETLDDLSVLMDIYAADKQYLFDLVSCVENSGLKVIELFLDGFAIGKEAALFEQSMDKYIILLDGQHYSTKMSLFYEGRLINFMNIPMGMEALIEALDSQYHIGFKAASRLIKYNVRLNAEVLSTQTNYVWAVNEKTHTLNEKLIYEAIKEKVDQWANMIHQAVEPIVSAGKSMIVLTNDMAEVQGISDVLSDTINCEVKTYAPETLGIRSPSLTSCAGLFYAYKDLLEINGRNENSVDVATFARIVDLRSEEFKEMTITNKLRNVLLQGKK